MFSIDILQKAASLIKPAAFLRFQATRSTGAVVV